MYNFHELKREYHNKPLPDDVNKLVEERSKKVFGDIRLDAMLIDVRIKKLYGTGYYIVNGFPVAEFEFHFGICPKFQLIGEVGVSFQEFLNRLANPVSVCVFKRSVHNEGVDLKGDRMK